MQNTISRRKFLETMGKGAGVAIGTAMFGQGLLRENALTQSDEYRMLVFFRDGKAKGINFRANMALKNAMREKKNLVYPRQPITDDARLLSEFTRMQVYPDAMRRQYLAPPQAQEYAALIQMQKQELSRLAGYIMKLDSNPDNWAKTTVSIAQNIFYDDAKGERIMMRPDDRGIRMKFPYEVLYDMAGVCQEKTMFTVALLTELGFKSAVLGYPSANHTAVGLGVANGYSVDGAPGYAFVEVSNPSIITDTLGDYSGRKLPQKPEIVVPVSDGRIVNDLSAEQEDARRFNAYSNAAKSGQALEQQQYDDWRRIVIKYGIFTAKELKEKNEQ